MKRTRCAAALLGLSLLFALNGCSAAGSWLSGCDGGGEVVFVQTGGARVVSVLVAGPDGSGGAQNADCSPLARGNSLSFDASEVGWPMTVTACRGADGAGPIVETVIPGPPPKGERWFVTLEAGEDGPFLGCALSWPEGV